MRDFSATVTTRQEIVCRLRSGSQEASSGSQQRPAGAGLAEPQLASLQGECAALRRSGVPGKAERDNACRGAATALSEDPARAVGQGRCFDPRRAARPATRGAVRRPAAASTWSARSAILRPRSRSAVRVTLTRPLRNDHSARSACEFDTQTLGRGELPAAAGAAPATLPVLHGPGGTEPDMAEPGQLELRRPAGQALVDREEIALGRPVGSEDRQGPTRTRPGGQRRRGRAPGGRRGGRRRGNHQSRTVFRPGSTSCCAQVRNSSGAPSSGRASGDVKTGAPPARENRSVASRSPSIRASSRSGQSAGRARRAWSRMARSRVQAVAGKCRGTPSRSSTRSSQRSRGTGVPRRTHDSSAPRPPAGSWPPSSSPLPSLSRDPVHRVPFIVPAAVPWHTSRRPLHLLDPDPQPRLVRT